MDPLDAEIRIKHLRKKAEILEHARKTLVAQSKFYHASMCEALVDVCNALADVMEDLYFPEESM